MIDFRTVDEWHIGNNDVEKAWLNGTLVWVNNKHLPFYVENTTDENRAVSVWRNNSNYYAPSITIYTSWDNITWELWGATGDVPLGKTLPPGGRLYMRATANAWATMDNANPGSSMAYNSIYGAPKVGGNIMSLLYGVNFENQITITNNRNIDSAFGGLFSGDGYLVNAGCLILPATTLASNCYKNMFDGCSSLVSAPELPATTIADSCYNRMFSGCSSLTEAPILSATTLAQYCYNYMFSGCSSLINAPELPALTLMTSCYTGMFQGCTSLNYIKCLSTDISALMCTSLWVYNVAATGTFVKDANTTWPSGDSGIPSGWTVIDA